MIPQNPLVDFLSPLWRKRLYGLYAVALVFSPVLNDIPRFSAVLTCFGVALGLVAASNVNTTNGAVRNTGGT